MEILKFIVFSFLMVIVVFLFYATSDSGKLSKIEKITGIHLPSGLSNIDVYDSGDFYIIAHVSIPEDRIETFIQTNIFFHAEACNQKCDTVQECNALKEKCRGHQKPDQMPGIHHLGTRYQFSNKNALLYFLNGKTSKNNWEFLMDRTSGDLWMAVFNTDKAENPMKMPPMEL